MGRIALRDYTDQISDLIDESRLEEAVAHCRNILEQHPRHVETYRLLGRALLDLEEYPDATDIFLRVLSADPGDLVSHAGLSIAYSSADKIDHAIWHMERAYDVEPYNRAIQVELSELYGRRDQEPPERMDMTRSALARLYLRGALYSLAEREIKTLLDEQPERIDLKVMLAEVLYKDRRFSESARLSLEIVDQLPLCITANAILAAVLSSMGRVEQADQHLMRVRSLVLPEKGDIGSEVIFADAIKGLNDAQLPKQVIVEDIDYIPVADDSLVEGSEWGTSSGMDQAEGKEMPDWLREFSGVSEDESQDDSDQLNIVNNNQDKRAGSRQSGRELPEGDEDLGPLNTTDFAGYSPGEQPDRGWDQGPGGSPDSIDAFPPKNPGAGPPGQVNNQVNFRQAKAIMVEALISQAESSRKSSGNIVEAQETFSGEIFAAIELESQLNEPGEAVKPGDIHKEEDKDILVVEQDMDEGNRTADSSSQESELIDPPAWLKAAVGLGATSAEDDREEVDEFVDALIRDGDTAELQSLEPVLPDWLVEEVGAEIEDKTLDHDNYQWSGLPKVTERKDDQLEFKRSDEVDVDHTKDWDAPDMFTGETESMEDMMMDSLDGPERDQGEDNEDLDGELSWLEELAASQQKSRDAFSEQSNPLDAMANESDDEDYIPDWLKADILGGAPASRNHGSDTSGKNDAMPAKESSEAETLPRQEIPDWLQEQVDEPAAPDSSDEDALDWFNQIVEGDETAIDELLTSQELDLGSILDEPDAGGADERPDWLAELENLEDEMIESEALPSVDDEIGTSITEPGDLPRTLEDEEDSDELVEAIAWLDQLAFEEEMSAEHELEEVELTIPDDQGSTETSLEVDTDEVDLSGQVPEDPDEAMAWLERLAAEQGAAEDELLTFGEFESDETDPSADIARVDELAESAPSDLEDIAMPSDQDEALMWLEELAGIADGDQGTAIEEEVAEEGKEDLDVPPLDALVSDETNQVLDWLAAADSEVEEQPPSASEPAEGAASWTGAEIDSEPELIESDLDETIGGTEVAVDSAVLEAEESVSDSSEDDDLAWLDSLEEANVTGWLKSEETLLSDQSESASQAAVEEEHTREPSPRQDLEEEVPELSKARSLLDQGDIDGAIDAYSSLVDKGEALPMIISDLEGAVEIHRDKLPLKQLLGEAYSRNGQLQKAIETFRQALDNL